MTDIVERIKDAENATHALFNHIFQDAREEIERLRTKIAEMEKRELVGAMYVGSYYGCELSEWEFDADQCACDRLNEAYVNNPTTLKLYAIPDTKGE